MGSQLCLTYFYQWPGCRKLTGSSVLIIPYYRWVILCVYVCVYFSSGTEAEIQCVGQHTPLSFWCKFCFSLGLPAFLQTEPLGPWWWYKGRWWCQGSKTTRFQVQKKTCGTLRVPLALVPSAVFGSQFAKLEVSVGPRILIPELDPARMPRDSEATVV